MCELKHRFCKLSVIVFLFSLPPCCYAVFINLDTTSHGFLVGDQVSLLVESVNKGDERALNVRFEAMFPGAPKSSPIIEKIEPNAKWDHPFEWSVPDNLKYRQLVIPVLTHYTDANLYPFSCVTCITVARETPAVVGYIGHIDPVTIADAGVLSLRLQSTDAKSHAVRLRLIIPREINAEPTHTAASVPAIGEVSFDFKVRNFSALQASSYLVWVIVSEDGAEGIVEEALIGVVRIDTKRNIIFSQWRWGIAGLAVMLSLFYLYHVVSVRKRK